MKKIITILLAAITVFSLTACGGGSSKNNGVSSKSSLEIGKIDSFGQNLLSKCSFDNNMSIIDIDQDSFKQNPQVDVNQINTVDGKLEAFRALGQPEEVLIIGAKDAAAAKAIADGPITDWINYNVTGYKDYGPDQVPKLESSVKMTSGRYVFLIISNDNAAAKKTLNELIDAELKNS